jgi:hypothetical protein
MLKKYLIIIKICHLQNELANFGFKIKRRPYRTQSAAGLTRLKTQHI